MRRNWILRSADEGTVQQLVQGLHLSPLIARFLVGRGLNSASLAGDFLCADLSHLSRPEQMAGLPQAVELIRNAAREIGGAGTFVGHIGGDDYVVLTTPELAEPRAEEAIRRFDRAAPGFYDAEDAARAYLEEEDRRGEVQRFPLLTISIGVASTATTRFTHRAEAVTLATGLKNLAKRTEGSSYSLDRRGGRVSGRGITGWLADCRCPPRGILRGRWGASRR